MHHDTSRVICGANWSEGESEDGGAHERKNEMEELRCDSEKCDFEMELLLANAKI